MIWAEKIPTYKVLSRDCRSDKTFEFIGYHSKDWPNVLKLLRLNKKTKRWEHDRAIPISILDDGIVRTSTSTYELQEETENGSTKQDGNI